VTYVIAGGITVIEKEEEVRKIAVTRQEGSWWSMPWTAYLYEDEHIKTCACAFTRDGAIRSLRSKTAYLDRPAPEVIHREEIPYETLAEH
jgi:hypothetical protein